jgi:hypothetical protein
MKQSLFLVIGITLIARSSFPQACSEASLLQTPGTWKEGIKGSQSGTAADLAREKKNVAAIHAMIKAKFSPTGVEAEFHGSYNPPSQDIPVISYSYSIIPLNYYCDGQAIKTAHETSSYFEIGINVFDAEIFEDAQGDRASAEGYNAMPDMPVEKDGYYFFVDPNARFGGRV